MKARVKTLSAIAAITTLILFSAVVFAAPDGPESIERGASERSGTADASGVLQEAEAGNMTSLHINTTKITKRWQGYYGNITGTITLDDADNATMYSWEIATVQGEIYASNGSGVTWANIVCLNFTSNTTEDTAEERYNLSTINAFIGLASDTEQADEDSVNATFNQTFGDDGASIGIGSVTINNQENCSMVTLYNNNGYQTTDFQEILLTDNESIVFTAILEQDTTGFQNIPIDFEMMVGVNGTSATAATHIKNYYFYVELS